METIPYQNNDYGGVREHILNILVMSDFHHYVEKEATFDELATPFIAALSEFLQQNPRWIPRCIVLAGDIAHCTGSLAKIQTAYSQVRNFIARLEQEIGVITLKIATPGNHDKICSSEGREYTTMATIHRDIEQYLDCRFSLYNDFAVALDRDPSSWHPVVGCSPVPVTAQRISGYYIADKDVYMPPTCFVVLNTEWLYHYKDNPENPPTVGEDIVKRIEADIDRYKRKGYTVVTIMHRSPYRLGWSDIYREIDGIETCVDRIIRMSDLIICGHEHNMLDRNPDLLMSHTTLYQNGQMMELKAHNGRGCLSASLLRVNTLSRTLTCRRIHLDSNEPFTNKWRVENDEKAFYLDPHLCPPVPPARTGDMGNPLFPEFVCARGLDPATLEKKIQSFFYRNDEKKTVGRIISVKCLDYMNIQDMEAEIDKLSTSGDEHVWLLYSKNGYDEEQKSEAEKKFKTFKKALREAEKGYMLTLNLVFCAEYSFA
ncbi:MAG: metallophosphoesterase [Mediterranea sp.]|jgi:hypothetical protein|nr:metallophosphoesterase [Mediterranea sp.]